MWWVRPICCNKLAGGFCKQKNNANANTTRSQRNTTSCTACLQTETDTNDKQLLYTPFDSVIHMHVATSVHLFQEYRVDSFLTLLERHRDRPCVAEPRSLAQQLLPCVASQHPAGWCTPPTPEEHSQTANPRPRLTSYQCPASSARTG